MAIHRAAIYARISSDPEGDRLGVQRQIDDCATVAERRGWTVSDQYVDDDRSAYSGRRRPEYRRLLDDIRGGMVEAVIVYNLDRLHRQPRELEEFFDVCDAAHLDALASVEGDINLASHDGRFHARILGAVARKESDDKSRRIRRKALELAQAGEPGGGGSRPFGYLADRATVDPTEAQVIREAAARILSGGSLRATASDLNTRGVATVSGRPWTIQVLRRMLLSARLSGQREYHGEIVATGTWDAILTPGQTAQLRALLGAPERLTRRTVRRYLLSGGLLRCGRCAAVLVSRPRGDGQRRYVCAKGPGQTGCGTIAVMADPIEDLITQATWLRLDSPALAMTLAGKVRQDAAAAGVQDGLTQDQAQLAELAEVYGQRVISLGEYLAARKPIQTRIDAARRQIGRITQTAALDRYVGHAGVLRSAWPDLPITRRHAIVAAILDHAVVSPAVHGRNAFDPSRVAPLWRV